MSVSNYLSKIVASVVCAGVSLSVTSFSHAQEKEPAASKWQITSGVGVMSKSTPWRGATNQVSLIPYLDLRKGNWHFNKDDLVGYHNELSESLSFSVGLGIRDDSYDTDDIELNNQSTPPIFDGYSAPKAETVVNYGMQYGWISFGGSSDVSNRSSANSLNLSVELPLRQVENGLSISAGVSLDWFDSNYVNYYYGVSGGQVNSSVGRVAYQSSAATNYGLELSASYQLNKRWRVLGSVSRTTLDDRITSSPLIDSNYEDTAVLMIAYRY